MSDLLDKTAAAQEWLERAAQHHSDNVFGRLVPAVIWSDARAENGQPLVPVDPVQLVAQINRNPHILLNNHDPGRPIGQVLEAANFETETGKKFIAALLGYYAGGEILTFQGVGLDTKTPVQPPASLPSLPDGCWIQFATGPREVEEGWLSEVTSDAPLEIKRTELSHNAADSAQELIRIGLVYLAVVWNPFITSVATEAGKDVYAAVRVWLRKLFDRLAECRNPVIDIQSHQDGCHVSFLFRGKEPKVHYAAHDALSGAAAQAAQLIANLKERGMPPRQLIYEFDKESSIWFPSYAVLNDNRIITDNAALVAIEQLPRGLSLGLSRGEFLSPAIRSALEDEDDSAN